MAALVQTLPSQTTVGMLQRPSSADMYDRANGSTNAFRNTHKHTQSASHGYRGSSSPAPAYAFTATPQLRQHGQHGRPSAVNAMPQMPQMPQLSVGSNNFSQRSPVGALPTFSPGSLSGPIILDDATLSPPAPVASPSSKPSPDRYRRPTQRTISNEAPADRAPSAASQMYMHTGQSNSSPSLNPYPAHRSSNYSPGAQTRTSSTDDMILGRQGVELASRYRRRSLGNLEVPGLIRRADSDDNSSPHPNTFVSGNKPADFPTTQTPSRPSSSHHHRGSSESIHSARSGHSSRPSSSRNESSAASTPPTATNPHAALPRQDPKALSVPNRAVEGGRRVPSPMSNPSPLSKPMEVSEDKAGTSQPSQLPPARPNTPKISSPAADHLAALNAKDHKKKSKLRRAFSFGSTAELRKAAILGPEEKTSTKEKRNSKYEDELEPEQAAIAQKQEAAGLGESIYSGQGHFFTGSTDNLSISSTASSASIMLRKMGKGMKKGTRSLVGLFRPKSVLGVPAADGPVNQSSTAQLSMVTVEAERQKVNVNLDPHDQAGGGTGFPKLGRNSLDNKMSIDGGGSQGSSARRSIVGGEKERADILAAVKKGILKRTDSGQSGTSLRPVDGRGRDHGHHGAAQLNDSPRSSAPSTPVDEPPRSGHRRTDSVTIENHDHDDYFSVSGYASLDSKTHGPLTPARNISFSPRIQFHDTWPAGEYDRRGDIATCNRLTPMLAQQIKEELNTFKMEMEVHESSKVYTHFF